MGEAKKLENIVLVGKKPIMTYVSSIMMLFMNYDEVVIKARGKSISFAVDIAEIVTKRFLKDVKVKDIKIGSDEFQGKDGSIRRASTMEIVLARKPIE
ncbi:MAG: DNA-binding protein Alba [Candidatus Bathyarchaeia archaeon]